MERKSKAKLLAEEAYVLDRATTVVLNAETCHMNGLIARLKDVGDSGEDPFIIRADMTRERLRLDPKGKYDEEEVIIYQLEKKRAR